MKVAARSDVRSLTQKRRISTLAVCLCSVFLSFIPPHVLSHPGAIRIPPPYLLGPGPGGTETCPSVTSGRSAGIPCASSSLSQVDPFYLRLFENGEKAFLEKNYTQAANDLQIAVFGLAKDKLLAGKAYIYLSLCYQYLANRGKSEECLTRAARLLTPEDMATLKLGEQILVPLRKLAADFRVDLRIPMSAPPTPPEKEAGTKPPTAQPPAKKKTEPPPVPDPAAKQISIKPPDIQKTETELKPSVKQKAKSDPPPAKEDPETQTVKPEGKTPPRTGEPGWAAPPDIKEFERQLKADPENTGIALELASLHLQRKGYKEAKKMLGRFLARRPDEARAVFLLAKSNFFLQDYRSAMNGFNGLSSPTAEAALERDTNFKVAVYKALCLFSMGQESSVPAFLNYINANIQPTELSRLLEEEGLTGRWEEMSVRFRL